MKNDGRKLYNMGSTRTKKEPGDNSSRILEGAQEMKVCPSRAEWKMEGRVRGESSWTPRTCTEHAIKRKANLRAIPSHLSEWLLSERQAVT